MSVVIAIKEKDKIVMGCDSQVSNCGMKDTLTGNSTKIFPIKKLNNSLIGGVGKLREIQIIQVCEDLIDELTILKGSINYEYVVEKLFTNIYNRLSKFNCIEKDEKGNLENYINSTFILAYKDKAFLICSDGSVEEIEDYLVIGSGSEVSIGVLENNKSKSAEKRIREAIKASSDKTLYVDNVVVIKST